MIPHIPVQIPRERIEASIERAHRTARSMEGHPNYDGESHNALHRYSCGYIGEDAFAVWLDAEGIIPDAHEKSDRREHKEPEFKIGNYLVEVKGSGKPWYNLLVIGAKRDLSASIFVHTRTRERDYTLGAWELCAWWTRAEVKAAIPGKGLREQYRGSPCRELADDDAVRTFDQLAAVLRRGSRPQDRDAMDYRRQSRGW